MLFYLGIVADHDTFAFPDLDLILALARLLERPHDLLYSLSQDRVLGEFHKPTEFLGFWSLIRSAACATFSLFCCMRSSQSSGLLNRVASGPLSLKPP